MSGPLYPTDLHERAANAVASAFAADPRVDTVLVSNSIARGRAVAESDVDMLVLCAADLDAAGVLGLEARWADLVARDSDILAYLATGPFAHIHLDVITGRYLPGVWDDGGGPDGFELEVGNHLAYAVPITEPGPALQALRTRWLPFYDEGLRTRRLAMVRNACLYDLDHVPFFLERGLPFQAFDRLYKAHQEFLQGLFIARRVYPLAYNKWIHEQVVEWLGLREVFDQLLRLPALNDETGQRRHAQALRDLASTYLTG